MISGLTPPRELSVPPIHVHDEEKKDTPPALRLAPCPPPENESVFCQDSDLRIKDILRWPLSIHVVSIPHLIYERLKKMPGL
jgi:hypothetical protein